MKSSPPRMEEPLAAIGWKLSVREELLQKKTWEPWGTTEHKPAVHPGSEEGQKPPELCEWEHSQLIEIIYLTQNF